ncbi:major capsid protein, partial [Escherichia coli]|uniref:major capsid protein n=5 Tax=Escherichia coli TaxID=562 RepID=UPI003D91684C
GACVEQDDKGWDARKRAYCLKIQPATGSFARNLIYSTKPIMGGNVWKKYRSFRAIKEALDTRRGSNSELETALKDLGDSVSFKGYMGDVAIVVYSGRYTDEDGTEKHFLDPDLMVLGNTALQGIVAYGGIQDPELIRMGLTKAELAPKNYIVPGDPAIEYVQTHSAPQPIPARINRFVTVRIG